MGKTLYLECEAGISGDMAVGAMLDLGADRDAMMKALDSIPGGGFRIEVSRVVKSGIDCCDFNVIPDHEHENHDHDMEYLHGEWNEHDRDDHEHTHDHDHDPEHMHEHDHDHEHMHDHDHEHSHHHAHSHRAFSDIRGILKEICMTEGAHELALRIFTILAEAEAKAHRKDIESVMFHEVGAVDSIADIVAFAVCFDSLGIDRVIIPYLSEGSGTVRCQHGILPVPVPAVLNIAEKWQLPLHLTGVPGEFVTPTGAAIAAAVRTDAKLPETFSIIKTGLGAGKRSYKRASILRAMLIREESGNAHEERYDDRIWKLESNIDDCSGELLGYTMDSLFRAGALDAAYAPIHMKKNRPGVLLTVICREEDRGTLEDVIFRETTTIGIRRVLMERTCLKREASEVETPWGTVKVKTVTQDGSVRNYPEYEDAAAVSEREGVPLQDVMNYIRNPRA